MSRVKTGRGSGGGGKCCLTCLIVSVVILAVCIGGVMIGANFAFNKFVSPHIGGVTLMESLSLLRGLYRADRDEIITEEFSSGDLNAFYENLNTALFQMPYSETENYDINLAEYNSLSDDEKNAMSEDERTAFLSKTNYRINIRSIMDAANFGETVEEGQEESAEVAAAEEEGEGSPAENLLKDLIFDFSTLSEYNEDDESDSANTPFVSLSITGKQVAAVVDEIVTILLESESGPLSEVEQLQDIENITDYIKVPQVKIAYTKTLAECETVEEYDKSVQFSITVEVLLESLVDMALSQFSEQLQSVPSVAINVAKKLIPKAMYLTVGAYPLDDTGEAYIKINNFSDEQVATMNTIINSLVGDRLSEESGEEEEGGEPSTEETGLNNTLQDINSKIVEVFSKLSEQNIAFDFVDAEGVGAMQLKHVETMLSLMGLIDPDDPYNLNTPGVINSVTPHMFLSAMKCLTVSYNEEDEDYDEVAKNYADSDKTTFLAALENGFGIESGYLSGEGINLLDSAILETLPDHISLSDNIDYSLTPAEMRVDLLDKALAALLTDALSSGVLTGGEETALAEEGGNNILSQLSFNQLSIQQDGEDVTLTDPVFNAGTPEEFTVPEALQKVYELQLVLALSLEELFGSIGSGEEEGGQSEIVQSIFGSLDSLYISAAVYVEEISDSVTGEIYSRTVGGEANPAAFRVNKFTYDNTDKVLQTITLIMQKMQSGETGEGSEESAFDFTELSGKVEEMLSTMFNTLETNLKAELRLDEGKIILPSIYEVISGVINEKAEVPADEMNADEVHGVFQGIYDSGIEVLNVGETPSPEAEYALFRYDSAIGDVFLSSLSTNYYMKEQIDTEALFNSEQINSMFTASSLNFTGAEGLYSDERNMDVLSVPMTGDALAALLVDSGQLDSLNSSEEGAMLDSLDIINAVIRADSGKLYIDFELTAHFGSGDEPAAAEGDGFSADGFLPELIYVTASVLMYSDDYGVEARFNTEVAINKMEEVENANLFKMVRVLTGETFDTSSVTTEIKNAMEQTFQNIEENINLSYFVDLTIADGSFAGVKNAINATYGDNTCEDTDTVNTIMLANVFNTLNKLSNDELYVSDSVDDVALRERLKEFGRQPEKSHDPVNLTGVMHLDNLYAEGDSDDFIDDFNRYYYIDQTNRLEADGLLSSSGFFATTAASSDTFNFTGTDISYPGLYVDSTPYDEATFAVRMSDKALAELIFLGSGEVDPISGERSHTIALGANGDYAIVVQSKIYEDTGTNYLSVSMQVYLTEPAPAPGEEPADVLPDYLFVTIIMDMDLLMTDPDSLDGEDLVLYVNGMNEAETADFFDRLDKMSTAMGFDMSGFNETDLKNQALDGIKNGFEQINEIDDVTYGEDVDGGFMQLPDFFKYIINYSDMQDYVVDGEGAKIADLGNPTGYQTASTTPITLASRLREFGGKPTEAENINAEDGITVYNDNRYAGTDDDYFFSYLKTNYYLKDEPTLNDFYSGTIFSTIDNSAFNLEGDTVNYASGEAGYYGLYHYTGAQNKARLSDKALAAVLSEEGESLSSLNMSIAFESLKMYFDGDTNLVFEITSKATFTGTNLNALPEYIYITSFTTRTDDGLGGYNYNTEIVINGFVINTGNTINLNYNLNQMSLAFGMSFTAFDTTAATNNISNMVESALNSLTSGLNVSYNTYALSGVTPVSGEDGIGYIEFKSIYGIISDTTLDDDTDATTAGTMQTMIVKLHDPDISTKLVTNPRDVGGESVLVNNWPIDATSYTTDRVFADKIGTINEDGVEISCDQAMFISINSANPERDAWETRFDAASDIGFAFDAGNDYISITGLIDLDAFITGTVALLPDEIYVSLLMNADDAVPFSSIMMFNEMNADETQLFLDIADGGGSADLTTAADNIIARVNTTLHDVLDVIGDDAETSFHPADVDYPDCVGYLKVYKEF